MKKMKEREGSLVKIVYRDIEKINKEVSKARYRMKTGKAVGPDEV